MIQLLHPRVLVASLVSLVAVIGCAHPKPAPAPMVYRPAPPPPPPPPPPKRVKLVVLPLDKLALPGTAEEINAKLAQVKLPGAEDAVLATVSMETAQLQSECADPTETCYLKIARLVEADRLLWAQVEKVSGKGKKKAKKASTRIQVVLFDREKLAVSGKADETFAGVITGQDLDKLIVTATGVHPSLAAAPESAAPPTALPPQAAAAPATPPPAAYPAQPQPAARQAYAPQPAPATAARQPVAQPATAPAGYRQPAATPAYAQPAAAAPQPTYAPAPSPPPVYAPPAASPPPAAAPPPPAYAPPAASPPPAAAPPPPAYAPPTGAPPSAPAPMPARWQ
jgi:hypothetical protein